MKPTIGFKLSLGFLAMLILLVGAVAVGIINITTMARATDTLAQEAEEIRSLLKVKGATEQARDALEGAIAAESTSGPSTPILRAKYLYEYLDNAMRSYIQGAARGEVQLIQELEAAYGEFNGMSQKYIVTLSKEGTVDQEESAARIEGTVGKLMTTLTALEDKNKQDITAAQAKAQRAHSSALTLMIGLGIVAAVLGIVMSIGITRSITHPIANLVEVADNLSMGNLDVSIKVTSRDEIGELQESIERMRVSLKTAIERLKKPR